MESESCLRAVYLPARTALAFFSRNIKRFYLIFVRIVGVILYAWYIYTHIHMHLLYLPLYIYIYNILNSVTTFTNHVHVYTYPKLSLSVLTCNPLSNFDCRCVTWLDGFALCTFCFLSFWHFRSDPESLKYEGGDRTIVELYIANKLIKWKWKKQCCYNNNNINIYIRL